MGLIDSSPTGPEILLLGNTVSDVGTRGGVAPLAPGSRPGAGGEQAALQIFPWWYYGPKGTEFFYIDSRLQIIAAGAQNVLLTNSTLQIGKGRLGVIVSLALLVDAPTTADNFIYTLLRNNGPEQGLDRLRNFQVSSAFSLRELNGYTIRLNPGDTVSWTISNNGAAARSVSVSYLGWTVPEAEVRRIQRGIDY